MAVLKYKSKDGTWKTLSLGSVSASWVKGQAKDLIKEKLETLDPAKVTVKQLTQALQSIYAETP